VPGGVVHALPDDLRRALLADPPALDAWNDITRRGSTRVTERRRSSEYP
jgi:hypothetical protein